MLTKVDRVRIETQRGKTRQLRIVTVISAGKLSINVEQFLPFPARPIPHR